MFSPKKHRIIVTIVIIFMVVATVLVYVPLFFR